jgi:hypothetical protein
VHGPDAADVTNENAVAVGLRLTLGLGVGDELGTVGCGGSLDVVSAAA